MAAATGACSAGAQCAETSQVVRVRRWLRAASQPVYPPQRVASSCRQSTTGAQPAGVVAGRRRIRRRRRRSARRARTAARPSRSSLLTGSSNHTTPRSSSAAPTRRAWAGGVAAVGVDHQLHAVAGQLA